MHIDFSIVVPTLNSEKFLEETLDSIKRQDRNIIIECIFSDGGSSDKTLQIINKFYGSNIYKVILLNKIGLSKALNSGFKVANGKYLTFLNSDDLLAKNALINTKNDFEKYEEVEWIVGICKNFGKNKFLNKILNTYKKIFLKLLNFNFLCINNIISVPSVYWKRSFFQKIGYFDENLNYNMDYDMWLRMLSISKPLKSNHMMSYFRRHNNSLSHKNLINQFIEKYKTMRRYNNNIILNFFHIILSSIIVIIFKISNY